MSKITDKIKKFFGLTIQLQTNTSAGLQNNSKDMVKPSVVAKAGSQVLQSLKPHVPMIKFRSGSGGHAVTGHSSAPVTSSQNPAKQAAGAGASQASSSGTIEDWQLPARYRRRPISEEEIAYINRGGPE